MWEYNQTPDSEELMHRSHKYTRKEYKNGAWRYYYGYGPKANLIERVADKLGFDERANYQKAKQISDKDDKYLNYMREKKNAPENQAPNVQDFINGFIESTLPNVMYSRDETRRYLNHYQATPLYKIEKSIEKGKEVVANIFEKITTKIKSLG